MLSAAQAITTADLAGFYSDETTGYEALSSGDWSWNAYAGNEIVTISKIDDTTIAIKNLRGYGDVLTATVDIDAGTLSIALKDDFNSYYTFCDCAHDADAGTHTANLTTNVSGTIAADGTITLNNWCMAYDSYPYAYGTTVLTPETPLWDVEADYTNEGWNSGKCQICAFDGFYMMYDYLAEGTIVKFTVDEVTAEIAIMNFDYEHSDEYPGYWKYLFTTDIDCIGIYGADGMSAFTGNAEKGSLTFAYEYYSNYTAEDADYEGTTTITWAKKLTIADLAGFYSDETTGYEALSSGDWSWNAYAGNEIVTI
ncbi:MAG: hypothetical protein ACI4A8_09440, partial [Muribaculaceae bacterium]